MKGLLICFAMVASLLLANVSYADEQKVVTGSIALSGGWTGAPTQHTDNTPTSVIGELKLQVAPRNAYGLTFDVAVRHAFNDDIWGYWASKRRFTSTVSMPIDCKKTTRVFLGYERDYSGRTNDFMSAGVELRF
jgi:hypothetical protein